MDEIGERLRAAVLSWPRAKVRAGADGVEWIDCPCPFHANDDRSASVQAEMGILVCRVCDRVYKRGELVELLHLENGKALAVPTLIKAHLNGAAPERKHTATFEYRWPDGRRSTIVKRFDLGEGRKEFVAFHEDGRPGRPDPFWPLYGNQYIDRGAVVVVVEGEGKVEAILAADDKLEGPIRGISMIGGSGAKFAPELAAYLKEGGAARIVLWRDNDDPGVKWLKAVGEALDAAGLYYAALDLKPLGLVHKGDVVDYLKAGKSLAVALDTTDRPTGNSQVVALVDRLTVLENGLFVYPGTRVVRDINPRQVGAAFQAELGMVAKPKQLEVLINTLTHRSNVDPTLLSPRIHWSPDAFWWRDGASAKAWWVSGNGVYPSDDPPGVFIRTEQLRDPLYPLEVDLGGNIDDWDALCDLFSLPELDRKNLEAAVACALTGQQTSIMQFRGVTGCGKTTLARVVLSIIDPSRVEMPAEDLKERDIVATLTVAPAFLVENVSRLSGAKEDLLCRLVTGMGTAQRTLYSGAGEIHRFQRILMVTSISWEPSKSDLSSRLILVRPKPNLDGFKTWDDTYTRSLLAPMVPRLRGHFFNRCVDYYRLRDTVSHEATRSRMGALSTMLATFGYDATRLAQQERETKRDEFNQGDVWMEVILNLTSGNARTEMTYDTMIDEIKKVTPDVPSRKMLHRTILDKEGFLRDYNIAAEYKQWAKARGWIFTKMEDDQVRDLPGLDTATD